MNEYNDLVKNIENCAKTLYDKCNDVNSGTKEHPYVLFVSDEMRKEIAKNYDITDDLFVIPNVGYIKINNKDTIK